MGSSERGHWQSVCQCESPGPSAPADAGPMTLVQLVPAVSVIVPVVVEISSLIQRGPW